MKDNEMKCNGLCARGDGGWCSASNALAGNCRLAESKVRRSAA